MDVHVQSTVIAVMPSLNLKLSEICKTLLDMVIESKLESNIEALKSRKEECLSRYNQHFKQKKLFGDLFATTTLTPIDTSDGVPRCGNCHWEAHGSVCLHCGTRFRMPRYSDDEEEEDDDYEDVRTSRGVAIGVNEGELSDAYDSNDSFIDSRPVEEIEGEFSTSHNITFSDDDLDVLSSEDEATRAGLTDWNGFESASSSVVGSRTDRRRPIARLRIMSDDSDFDIAGDIQLDGVDESVEWTDSVTGLIDSHSSEDGSDAFVENEEEEEEDDDDDGGSEFEVSAGGNDSEESNSYYDNYDDEDDDDGRYYLSE
ncbi:PSH1 [Candida oxycetoniae]|uniref:PSH1 n=1 Tax=Candida oxycetoniae TaxID=497107 RepID=A0AAI9WYT0_9ASCO|nr:PSH1 [Candida oxycetoniae]KAI3405632.2 PSH1 [Candida oxycetoniae]